MDAREELRQMEELAALEAKMKAAAGREEIPTLLEKTGRAVVSGGKSLARGFLKGLAGMAEGAAGFNYAERMGRPPEPGQELTQGVEKVLPVPAGETRVEQLARKGLEGAGGALTLPVPGAGLVRNMIPGAASGVSEDLARSWAKPLGGTWENILGTGAGVLAGGLAGGIAGPRQSVAQADIRRELAGQPPGFFDAARRNTADALGAGSTTATAGEMFPGRSGILALTSKAAGQKGGEMLRNQLGGREDDLRQLTEAFLRRMGPNVNPAQVANQAADAAGGVFQEAKNIRGDALRARLLGQTVNPFDLAPIYNGLLARSANEVRPDAAIAYQMAAQAMVGTNGQLITDLQQLSLALKSLKAAMKNPNDLKFNGSQVSAEDLRRAVQVTEMELGQISQPFREGMQEFGQYTQQVLDPLRKGPVGSLMDKNPLTAGQTPVGRLTGLVDNNDPRGLVGTTRQLNDPVMTGGTTVTPGEIAKAIYQQRLKKGSQNPGEMVRGEQGSLEDQKLQALLGSAGLNADRVTQPLRAADNLKLNSAGGISGFPEMRWSQAAIRPFRTIDMILTGKTERDINRELARLLGGPLRPEQIDELQRIAMFDPNIRRMLTLRAAGQPLITPGE